MRGQAQTNKKSGHPTPPGNRSTVQCSHAKNKRDNIIHEYLDFFKRANWKGRLLLVFVAALAAATLAMILWFFCLLIGDKEEPATDTAAPLIWQEEYIFRDGDGNPVDMQSLTDAWAAEAGETKRYNLTDAERWEVASVVTVEAEGEPFAGKVAVAQCILQACEDDGVRPFEALAEYNYAEQRPEPSKEALEAVQTVFDFGLTATSEPIKYFYAPALIQSHWHESQVYVMTINGHRFFKEAD